MKKHLNFPISKIKLLLLNFLFFFSLPSNAFLAASAKKNITYDQFVEQKENPEFNSYLNYKTKLETPGIITSSGNSFTGIGNFPGSAIINIMFSGQLSNSGFISQQVFSFGGIHGTITQMGNISQYVYNGITYYQQNFSETSTLPIGRIYTRYFVVHGSIYGNAATVTGIQVACFI